MSVDPILVIIYLLIGFLVMLEFNKDEELGRIRFYSKTRFIRIMQRIAIIFSWPIVLAIFFTIGNLKWLYDVLREIIK